MPIKSYLVFPHKNMLDELEKQLRAIPDCDVIPAENKELLVVVTDTESKDREEICLNKINSLRGLDHITFVSGFESEGSNNTNLETTEET